MQINSEQKRLYTLIGVMACAVLITVLATIAILYQQAYDTYKGQLLASVNSQKELIAAVGRFDASNSQQDHAGGSIGGTLSQVIDAHTHFKDKQNSIEFLLVEKRGEQLIAIMHHTFGGVKVTHNYSLGGQSVALPEWLTQANISLSGADGEWEESGVLAVFTQLSIPPKQFYIIEKIDISEIRQPFVQAFLFALLIALTVILLGTRLISNQVNPIIRYLNQQLAFNKTMLDTAIVPIITTNAEQQITNINRATSEIFDYTENELIGQSIELLFKVQLGVQQYEASAKTKQNTALTLRVSQGMSIQEKEQLQVFIASDITQIKFAEEQLRDATAHNAAIVDTVPEAIFTLNTQGDIESANPAAEKIFGYFLGELESLNIHQLLQQHIDLETPSKNVEITAKNKQQQLFPTDVSIAHFTLKNKLHVSCIVRDITERKAAEEKLRQHQEHLTELVEDATKEITAIVETAIVGIITFNQAGEIKAFNPAAESIFGCTKQGVLGVNISSLIPDIAPATQGNTVKDGTFDYQALTVGRKIEAQGVKRDYSKFPIEMAVGHKQLSNQEHLFVAYINDITLAKEAESELIAARNKAVEAAKVKANFLANMSHEIRTPMNAILGFADILANNQSLDTDAQKHIATIRNSGKSLLNIINDILDFSKFESGKMELESVCFNLGNLLQDCVKVMELKAQEKGLYVHLNIVPDEPYRVTGDPSRLRQVIMNLLGNAVKFTEQGEISITADKTSEGYLQISVADTGIGMTQHQLATVFESFSQADSSTTRKFGGTGLGTTISRQLVEAMQGEIWAESELGKGSTFSFTANMPETTDFDKCLFEGLVDERESVESKRTFRILLAEDIVENATLARIRLEEQGHQVHWAKNGKEVLYALEEAPFDLILMDVMMPEMDGLEATRQIRKSTKAYAEITIIALTASVMKEDFMKCLDAGMHKVEGKPIDFNSLFNTMETTVPSELGTARTVQQQEQIISLDLSQLDIIADVEKALKSWRKPETYLAALKTFIADKHTVISEFERAIEQQQMEAAKAIIHAIKGAAGNLQLTHIYHSSQVLDEMLKHHTDISAFEEEIASIKQFVKYSEQVLAAFTEHDDDGDLPDFDADNVANLLNQAQQNLLSLNPDDVSPQIEALYSYLPKSEVEQLNDKLNAFDFDGVGSEIQALQKKYRLNEEAE